MPQAYYCVTMARSTEDIALTVLASRRPLTAGCPFRSAVPLKTAAHASLHHPLLCMKPLIFHHSFSASGIGGQDRPELSL
jgi:hypothetical protein